MMAASTMGGERILKQIRDGLVSELSWFQRRNLLDGSPPAPLREAQIPDRDRLEEYATAVAVVCDLTESILNLEQAIALVPATDDGLQLAIDRALSILGDSEWLDGRSTVGTRAIRDVLAPFASRPS
jgi:hypothetical protein